MKDFIGLEKFIDQEYSRRTDHRFHAMGHAPSPEANKGREESVEIRKRMAGKQPWASLSDLAWTVCLYHCEAIDRERAAALRARQNPAQQITRLPPLQAADAPMPLLRKTGLNALPQIDRDNCVVRILSDNPLRPGPHDVTATAVAKLLPTNSPANHPAEIRLVVKDRLHRRHIPHPAARR